MKMILFAVLLSSLGCGCLYAQDTGDHSSAPTEAEGKGASEALYRKFESLRPKSVQSLQTGYEEYGLLLDAMDSAPLVGLGYDPRFLFVAFGGSTTTGLKFGKPFRSYRASDAAGSPNGARYRQLEDENDRAFSSVLSFHIRFNRELWRGEKEFFFTRAERTSLALTESRTILPSFGKEGEVSMKSLRASLRRLDALNSKSTEERARTWEEERDAAVRNASTELARVINAVRPESSPRVNFFTECASFEFTVDFFLSENTGKDQIAQALRSQGGVSIQGQVSACNFTFVFNELTGMPGDQPAALVLSCAPAMYGWVSSDFSMGSFQYMCGAGSELGFVIPGFLKQQAAIKTKENGSSAEVRMVARAAEFRIGAYYGFFNTPSIQDHTILRDGPVTGVKGSFLKLNKSGFPVYENKQGLLITANITMPLVNGLLIFTRCNALVSRDVSVWEIQFGISISLTDFSKMFG